MSDGRIVPVKRASWWATFCHALGCGGGYWDWDMDTGEQTCLFCGFRYQWPSTEGSTHFVGLRSRAARLRRRG